MLYTSIKAANKERKTILLILVGRFRVLTINPSSGHFNKIITIKKHENFLKSYKNKT